MIIDINDEQKYLLLKTLGKAHMVQYMMNNDNSDLEELIKCVHKSLKEEGNVDIFHKVFKELKK